MRLLRQLTINDEKLEKLPFRRELSMQAYLIENPEILNIDDSYSDVQIYEEEIPLLGGGVLAGRDGRIDMIASYAGAHIAIIELKKSELHLNHLDQLEAYLEQKTQLLALATPIIVNDENIQPKWLGILIGDSINAELESKISNGYSYKGTPIAAMTIERFRGATGHVYVITDTYFKNQLTGKDRTKYLFGGRLYGKGRLVLAVMQKYASDHPDITFEQLRKAFPFSLQGKEVFTGSDEANKEYIRSGYKRHFIKESEIIFLNNAISIAISSQWGVGNIGNFITHAQSLGYKISETQ